MFGDGALTFHEFATREPHPLAVIHDAVLEFLRDRKDAVLYGAHAVNAYIKQPRMSQDVDIASTRAKGLADEVRQLLKKEFRIRVRVQSASSGYGIAQVRKPKYRHLVDVRPVNMLPPVKRVKRVQVATPPELIASKMIRMVDRMPRSRGFLDKADLCRPLLTFPELKNEQGPVAERLRAAAADETVMAAWKELVAEEILPENEDDKFNR